MGPDLPAPHMPPPQDPSTLSYVTQYKSNEQLFFSALSTAYAKVSTLGCSACAAPASVTGYATVATAPITVAASPVAVTTTAAAGQPTIMQLNQ